MKSHEEHFGKLRNATEDYKRELAGAGESVEVVEGNMKQWERRWEDLNVLLEETKKKVRQLQIKPQKPWCSQSRQCRGRSWKHVAFLSAKYLVQVSLLPPTLENSRSILASRRSSVLIFTCVALRTGAMRTLSLCGCKLLARKLRLNSHRMRDATRNARQANGTCCHQWECSHCTQATSKEKPNLRAPRVARPV